MPFALDCAALPASDRCQGGPREVLLATHERGLVAMFDPLDGHFLGYWKNQRLDDAFGSYVQFTQGPDQCLWSLYQGDRAGIERWDTGGEPLGEPISLGADQQGTTVLVAEARSMTFEESALLLGALGSDGAPRVLRYGLDGMLQDIVLDDGSSPEALLALRDGRLVLGDSNLGEVRVGLPGEMLTTMISGVAVSQLAPLASDVVLVGDGSEGCAAHELDLASGGVQTRDCSLVGEVAGVWPLANDGMLISGAAVSAQRPGELESQFTTVWDDPAVATGRFRLIGRACLPEAVVEAAARPAETACAEPPDDAQVAEDFEAGDFAEAAGVRSFRGFVERSPSTLANLDDTTGAGASTRSLRLAGAGGPSYGLALALATAPTYLRYDLKVEAAPGRRAYVSLGDDLDHAALVWVEGSELRTSNTRVRVPIADGTFHRIELRNIDVAAGGYDLYVDCERVAEDVPLAPIAQRTLTLFNVHTGANVWFDDVVLR